MPKGKGRRLGRSLKEGGKVMLSGGIGVLSLAGNFYFVWTGQDWSNRPYYELYTAVITVTAATAAVGIGLVVYTPEVVKVFGETFLAKRYAAGREEEREEIRAELRRLLAENPETVAERLEEWLGNGDAPRNGKDSGKGPAG